MAARPDLRRPRRPSGRLPAPLPGARLALDRGSLRLEAPQSTPVPPYLTWDPRVGAWRTEAINHLRLCEDAAGYSLTLEDAAARFFECPPLRPSLPPLRPDQEAAITAWERAGTEKETEARRFLKVREGRVAAGQPVLPRVDRVRYDEIVQDLRQHYRITGSRDLTEVEKRLKHLDRFFTGRRVATISGADATAYVEQRQTDGAANGTINRELAVLGRMLRLAYENGKLLRVPVIRKLKEAAPRQGFFERPAYEAVRRRRGPDRQVAVALEYAFGWRCQSEVLTLEIRQVDLAAGTIRLDPGSTKNDDGRVVYLPPDLKVAIAAQIERVRALERQTGRIIPYLFPHFTNGRYYKKGDRRRDFRKAWETACQRAGCPKMLRHDFRRTAVRNMVNAGVAERVAMKVTGHKTRAVFDRYHIVSPGDLQDVARRLTGTLSGTLGASAVEGRSGSI